MHVFDASAIIHGWDNYPIVQFPPLWDWLGTQIDATLVAISDTAYGEVRERSPDCWDWLKNRKIMVIATTEAIINRATNIKQLLNIVNENYHPNGVGENDILIIASAKETGAILVSNERRQPNNSVEDRKSRIPRVCSLLNTPVECQDFLEYIKSSGAVYT